MSETLATEALNSELQSAEPQQNDNERVYSAERIPAWYRPTYDLIMANLDVVGRCKWAGNEKMRLGAAMWKHDGPTPENVDIFHAEVVEFLTDAANETEEENPEEDKPEEIPAEANTDNQNADNHDEEADPEEPEKNKEPEVQKPTVVETQTEATETIEEPLPQAVEFFYAEAPIVAADAPVAAETNNSASAGESSTKIQAARPTNSKPAPKEAIKPKVQQPKILKPIKPEAAKPVAKMAETRSAKIGPAPQTKPKLAVKEKTPAITKNIEKSVVLEDEPPKMPAAARALIEVVKPGAEDSSDEDNQAHHVEAEAPAIMSEGQTTLAREALVPTPPELVVMDAQPPEDEPAVDEIIEATSQNQVEDAALVEESNEEPAEIWQPAPLELVGENSETVPEDKIRAMVEIESPEPTDNLFETVEAEQPEALVAQETETVIRELAEVIQTGEPEEIERIHDALDQIKERRSQLEVDGEIDEEQAHEEAARIYAQLFESLSIEYSQETIEAITNMSLKPAKATKLRLAKDEPEVVKQGRGTHEIIVLLSAALSDMREVWDIVWAIGKPAVESFRAAA